jgi:type III secretion protein Q
MNRLTALRYVDEEAQALGNVRTRLQHLGYQPQENSFLAAKYYLRFHGEFADASKISGYIDIASWMSQALPALEGIDWFSVDEQILPSLIASYPLRLKLTHQHVALKTCQIVELVKDTQLLIALPSLAAAPGVVLVENFTRVVSETFSDEIMNGNLPIPLVFNLGHSALPYHALSSIQTGDVLLIEHVAGQINTHGKTLFKFELEQESIMITESDNEEPVDADSHAHQAGGRTGLDHLPIELSIVLMEKTVSLAELKTITPGEVMSLPPEALTDVEIRANQRSFARGELIQLSNGQLGVEIRKIWS